MDSAIERGIRDCLRKNARLGMVESYSSQRHQSELPVCREHQLTRPIREWKDITTGTEHVASRYHSTGARRRISRVPRASARAADWFDEGRTRSVYHFRGACISPRVCAEHLHLTHSGACTCISRTDYFEPPTGVAPFISYSSMQHASDLRPATPSVPSPV